MLMSSVGIRPEKVCTGNAQKKLKTTTNFSSERVPHINKSKLLKIIKERIEIGRRSQMGA
jgi:hypothetical protein